MKCPNCGNMVTVAVCPECSHPLKQRAGLIIPTTDSLTEINYAVGKLYARYYRIAVLRAEGQHPTKLCFGCEERPLGFLTGKQAWFNPVVITPDLREILWKINISQICAGIAYDSLIHQRPLVDLSENSLLNSMTRETSRRTIHAEATRFLKMMQGV